MKNMKDIVKNKISMYNLGIQLVLISLIIQLVAGFIVNLVSDTYNMNSVWLSTIAGLQIIMLLMKCIDKEQSKEGNKDEKK